MHTHLKLLFLILPITQPLFAMEPFGYKQEIIPTINPALLHFYPIAVKQEEIEPPLEPQVAPIIAPVLEAIQRSTRTRKPSVLFKDFITDKLEKSPVDETDDNFIVLYNYNSKKRTKVNHNRPFVCNLCEQPYPTQHYLNRHIRTAHNNDRPYTCYLCNRSFKQKHHCVEHVKRHGQTHVQCPECSKRFKRNSECTRHLKEIHHIENNYE